MKYPTPYDNSDYNSKYEDDYVYEQPEPVVTTTATIKQYKLPRYDKKNVFSLPSVIAMLMFMLSSCFMAVYEAVEDEKVTLQEKLLIGYLVIGGFADIVARASEGATAVYSPKGFPGKNKDDYDEDGVPNDEDSHPYDSTRQ